MSKVSKPAVHYRGSSSSSRRCGTCDMYSSGTCSLVAGAIDPQHVCDKWEAKAVSATPNLDRVVALAGMSYEDAKSRAEHSVWPHAHMPADFHGDTTEPAAETRSRDYTREEHGRLERVSGHALRAHMLAHHPGVYPYLMEGRDLGDLHDMHLTDHERHESLAHDRDDWGQ